MIAGCLFCFVSAFMGVSPLYPAPAVNEELQYKHINFDYVTCDVGIAYRSTPYGMDISVSAIALGKFEDFRRWRVEKVKLRLGDERIRPDKCEKFFVRKASFWKYPAAVLWAVIGSQYTGLKDSGTIAEGLGKIGMAVGLGLLTLQAKGDIPGEVCTFYLKGRDAGSINYGVDSVRIEIRNQDTNDSEDIVVPLTREPQPGFDSHAYDKMSKEELSQRLEEIDAQVAGLEFQLKNCKSRQVSPCSDIQSKLDIIHEEQAVVYKAWANKSQ